jgi:hypothetical protein
VGHVTLIGEIRNAHKNLIEDSERKRPLGKLRQRWKNYIRIDL